MGLTPMKAIRKKCLECCNNSSEEVKQCTIERCTLYPFRTGKKPTPEELEQWEEKHIVKTIVSDERREKARQHMVNMHLKNRQL